MTLVRWTDFPPVTASRWGRPWLQMLAIPQMATNIIKAYGKAYGHGLGRRGTTLAPRAGESRTESRGLTRRLLSGAMLHRTWSCGIGTSLASRHRTLTPMRHDRSFTSRAIAAINGWFGTSAVPAARI
jgi:hypothetical protein